jgi:drug/metabolite transporter (DMT)-like permease
VTKSADVSITSYIQPITSVVTAVFFFSESFTPALAAGAAVVFTGLYLVEGHKLKGAHNHGHHR